MVIVIFESEYTHLSQPTFALGNSLSAFLTMVSNILAENAIDAVILQTIVTSLGTLLKPVPTSNFAEFARSHLTTVDFVHTLGSTNVQLLDLLLGTLLLVRNRSANRKSSKNRKWNSLYVCVMILLPAPTAASIKVTASTANPAATEQYLLAKKQLNDLAQRNLENKGEGLLYGRR